MLYEEIGATVFEGDYALTAEQAKKFLGWTTPEPDGDPFSFSNTHLKDREGKTVWCNQCTTFQRIFYRKAYETVMWDILSGQWVFNGETVIIGNYGNVLDGKHRLTALVLAVQEWERNPDRYPHWETEPTVDVIVVTGISEEQRVVQTIGTGKARSLADSIYSSGIFQDRSKSELTTLSKMLDHSVRFVWERTHAVDDAYSPVLSHADAMDFVGRHPTLVEVCETIFEINGKREKSVQKLLTLGYASGLCYLMAASRSDLNEYLASDVRDESALNFDARDAAEDFWTNLAGNEESHKPLRSALATLDNFGGGSVLDRVSLIAKAWSLLQGGEKVTEAKLVLKKEPLVEGGVPCLLEFPTVGGIDQGPLKT